MAETKVSYFVDIDPVIWKTSPFGRREPITPTKEQIDKAGDLAVEIERAEEWLNVLNAEAKRRRRDERRRQKERQAERDRADREEALRLAAKAGAIDVAEEAERIYAYLRGA